MALSDTFGLIPLISPTTRSVPQQGSRHNRPVISCIENALTLYLLIFYKKHDYAILYHICGNETVQVVAIHHEEMREPDFLHGQ